MPIRPNRLKDAGGMVGWNAALSGMPHPSYPWRNRSDDRPSALIDRNVLHRDLLLAPRSDIASALPPAPQTSALAC